MIIFNKKNHFLKRINYKNLTNYPNKIDINDTDNILIKNNHKNKFHVTIFQKNNSLIKKFKYPYIKINRYYELKITSKNYIITLTKNNHHILILNTLYIT